MTRRAAGSRGLGAAAPGEVDVCHVITRLIVGGAQENTVLTCAGLARAGHRCLLVTGPQTGPEGDLRGEAEQLEVPVCVVPSLVREVAPRRDLAAVLRLRRIFERSRPRIVHTHSSKAGILGRLAARWARVPVVVHTVHGWGFHGSTPPARRAAYVAVERLVARWTARLVVVSERDRTAGLGDRIGTPGQYTLIRSGVDLAPFREARRHRAAIRASLGLPPTAPVIGAVTRLAAQKDPTTLVRAAGAVLRDLAGAHLVIVGDGPLRGECERLVAALGIAPRVRLTGIRRDVAALMGAFDVLALTSLWEGLPRVIPQAMAAGVPIVASAVDGVTEVIEDGRTGLLVPPGNPDVLAGRLRALLLEPGRGQALAARAGAHAGEFELDEMLRRLDALYRELGARAARP